jgi:hypothetical protein
METIHLRIRLMWKRLMKQMVHPLWRSQHLLHLLLHLLHLLLHLQRPQWASLRG